LLCLGADIALISVLQEPSSKSKTKGKKECLRVTMVHGDIVVLSGHEFEARVPFVFVVCRDTRTNILWQFSTVRTGMCLCK
jgi:hypothetical protein